MAGLLGNSRAEMAEMVKKNDDVHDLAGNGGFTMEIPTKL
jgi:flagella basal body P-ring formation protein FlgA